MRRIVGLTLALTLAACAGADLPAPAPAPTEPQAPGTPMPAPEIPGRFHGRLDLIPDRCPEPGRMQLGADFNYVDSRGVHWQAAAGNCTDGASIPALARPIVGHPFDDDLIRAAVIHDHYCTRRVHTWPETHWVFYDALRSSGVPRSRALTMYFAVMAAGPKWIRLDAPQPCTTDLGYPCIRLVQRPAGASHVVEMGPGGRVLALSAARYDDPGLRDEMTLLERSLVAEGVDEPMDARVEAEWLAEMAERAFDRFGRDSRFVQDLGPAPRLIPERGAP